MKVYKIELLIVNTENNSITDIVNELENTRYVYPTVMRVVEREVNWSDEHPLNKKDTQKQTYLELFKD